MAERKGEDNVIVFFPFMAQGHIIPFMALALQIEQQIPNSTIALINTPLNVNNLRSSLPSNSSIRLLQIPFNSSDHGLPPNSENTDVLPYHLVVRLLQSSASLKPSFKTIIQDMISPHCHRRRLCIVADIFFGWTVTVAKELGVFHVIFSGNSGYGLACYCSLWKNLPHRKVYSDEFTLPDFPEARTIHRTQLPLNISEADGTDLWSLYMRDENLSHWFNSDGFLFNTVEEFDSLGLHYFRRKHGQPAWAIGPVLSSARTRKEGGIGSERCLEWLDTKPLSSVLYVSFGSMNTISASQMKELAIGLEASGKNFIWVVRPPIGFDINSEFKGQQWLPEGFQERIEGWGRGLIVHSWAPQVEILSHRAVSVFLSHCGWNSMLEALSNGVPIMGWPLAAEQFFNCKFLEEEVGVCVEVARGKSCEVKHEEIAAKIELVMGETEKGKEMRMKVGGVRNMIKNCKRNENGFRGSSAKAMDDFLSSVFSGNLA